MPQRGSELAQGLGEYLCAQAAFDWPTHNCTHVAAGWVEWVEGRRINLPSPANAKAAALAVKRLGGWRWAVSNALGRGAIAVELARTGDLVLMTMLDGSTALAICCGRTSAAIDPHGAVVHLPTLQGQCAWRVEPLV